MTAQDYYNAAKDSSYLLAEFAEELSHYEPDVALFNKSDLVHDIVEVSYQFLGFCWMCFFLEKGLNPVLDATSLEELVKRSVPSFWNEIPETMRKYTEDIDIQHANIRDKGKAISTLPWHKSGVTLWVREMIRIYSQALLKSAEG